MRLDTPPGQPSRYRVDAPAGAPVERIAIATDDVAFWRDVRVFAGRRARRRRSRCPARETIYRVRLDDADLDAERLDVDLVRPVAAPLIVEIDDGDSPPLARPRVHAVRAWSAARWCRRSAAPLTLYYGNAATRRPVYDLEALRTRLSLVERYPQAHARRRRRSTRASRRWRRWRSWPSRGAAADTSKWAVARALRISGGDDVYTLTLAPADLAYLRPDLGDIRARRRRAAPGAVRARAARRGGAGGAGGAGAARRGPARRGRRPGS